MLALFLFPYRTVTGLTKKTSSSHFIRSMFDGICFQTKDVMLSMQSDTGYFITALNVDGGMAVSNSFLQILSNLCGIPVGESLFLRYCLSFFLQWVSCSFNII